MQLKLHNLHIEHAMIQSELRYLIGAKVKQPIKWNHGPGSTQPKTHVFMSGWGNNPTNSKQVRFCTGLELVQAVFLVQTQTAGALPRSVSNTT